MHFASAQCPRSAGSRRLQLATATQLAGQHFSKPLCCNAHPCSESFFMLWCLSMCDVSYRASPRFVCVGVACFRQVVCGYVLGPLNAGRCKPPAHQEVQCMQLPRFFGVQEQCDFVCPHVLSRAVGKADKRKGCVVPGRAAAFLQVRPWGGSAAASCLLLVTTPAAVHQCVHMCANVGRVSCCVACCRAELDASWACLVKAATLPNASWELFEHLQCRAASGPGQAHAQCGVHSAD